MNVTSSDQMHGAASIQNSEPEAVQFTLEEYRRLDGVLLTLTAELARRTITLADLMQLKTDDVLVFARPTGENVDLFAGNVLIGSAEFLALGEKLAVRVADLLCAPGSLPHEATVQSPGSQLRDEGPDGN